MTERRDEIEKKILSLKINIRDYCEVSHDCGTYHFMLKDGYKTIFAGEIDNKTIKKLRKSVKLWYVEESKNYRKKYWNQSSLCKRDYDLFSIDYILLQRLADYKFKEIVRFSYDINSDNQFMYFVVGGKKIFEKVFK